MTRGDAVRLATASGLLLLFAGASGGAVIALGTLALLEPYLPQEAARVLGVVAYALQAIAAFGGATVLAGAWALYHERDVTGRFLVQLGAGAAVLSFVLHALGTLLRGDLIGFFGVFTSLHGLGAILAVAAVLRAPKVRVPGTRWHF